MEKDRDEPTSAGEDAALSPKSPGAVDATSPTGRPRRPRRRLHQDSPESEPVAADPSMPGAGERPGLAFWGNGGAVGPSTDPTGPPRSWWLRTELPDDVHLPDAAVLTAEEALARADAALAAAAAVIRRRSREPTATVGEADSGPVDMDESEDGPPTPREASNRPRATTADDDVDGLELYRRYGMGSDVDEDDEPAYDVVDGGGLDEDAAGDDDEETELVPLGKNGALPLRGATTCRPQG